MLAHELRNPLAPISTAAQMLKLPGRRPEACTAHAAEVIGRQVRHMVELVDDLLDVSRVTRGLVELERLPVDLRTVIAQRHRTGAPADREKGPHARNPPGARPMSPSRATASGWCRS